jgi:hypothetical protein
MQEKHMIIRHNKGAGKVVHLLDEELQALLASGQQHLPPSRNGISSRQYYDGA